MNFTGMYTEGGGVISGDKLEVLNHLEDRALLFSEMGGNSNLTNVNLLSTPRSRGAVQIRDPWLAKMSMLLNL